MLNNNNACRLIQNGIVPCRRCQGRGIYYWGTVTNGIPAFSGTCFRCGGGCKDPKQPKDPANSSIMKSLRDKYLTGPQGIAK